MSVPSEAEALLAGAKLMAHLATSVDDRPHVAPVWYRYADGRFELLTGGRKLANLRRNPRVAVSVEANDGGDAEWTVTAQGTAAVVDDPERVRSATRAVFTKYLGTDVEAWPDHHRETLEEGPDGELVEVTVGSAAFQRY